MVHDSRVIAMKTFSAIVLFVGLVVAIAVVLRRTVFRQQAADVQRNVLQSCLLENHADAIVVGQGCRSTQESGAQAG
jgi:hypothetical protein